MTREACLCSYLYLVSQTHEWCFRPEQFRVFQAHTCLPPRVGRPCCSGSLSHSETSILLRRTRRSEKTSAWRPRPADAARVRFTPLPLVFPPSQGMHPLKASTSHHNTTVNSPNSHTPRDTYREGEGATAPFLPLLLLLLLLPSLPSPRPPRLTPMAAALAAAVSLGPREHPSHPRYRTVPTVARCPSRARGAWLSPSTTGWGAHCPIRCVHTAYIAVLV